MLAGVVASAGYYIGSQPLSVNFRPIEQRQANPKGNLEDVKINAINEAILDPLFPRRPRTRWGRRRQSREVVSRGTRWAAAIPTDVEVREPPGAAELIEREVAHAPFCFKDPRFCYTLPVWRPYIGDAAFLCVFREPARTARSILTEWGRHKRRYRMTFDRALAIWRCSYQHVLQHRRRGGDWLFLHYDQVISGAATPRIEGLLEARIDDSFADPALKRSAAAGDLGPHEQELYAELCALASFAPEAQDVTRSAPPAR